VRIPPARTLAAAGTAGAGAATGAAAYLIVGGLPGVLYAAGICLACIFGAVAIAAGRAEQAREPGPDVEIVPRRPRWRRKKHILAELEATSAELEEHRQALANLGAQLAREAEAAHQNALRLESQIQQLETERDALKELVSRERERFEQTLDELGGGIGRHGNELAELERELEALIAR
jgi:predicted RNase H-like nuclease (RuvC/YqgF family)